MSHTSAADPKLLGTLEGWLRTRPEILMLFRYSRAAGSRDFYFFPSFQAISDRIRQSSALTSITAFRQPQLPLRAVVDDDFIARCLREIPDGAEFCVLELELQVRGKDSWSLFTAGESHAELREDLEETRGIAVAVGLFPPFWEDSEDIISAVVPDENGALTGGVY